jgi:hypothetical protein
VSGGAGGSTVVQCISIADDLIADFTTDNGLNPADGRQGGFYVYGDSLGTFDPPKNGDEAYPIDTTTGNDHCSGPGSFHVKASGFAQWGAAAGADFMPKDGTYKGTYDASKYKGVSFWATATASLTGVQVSFPDVYTDAAANPTPLDPNVYPCVYTAGALNNCSPYLVKLGNPQFAAYVDYQIDTTWKRFDIFFADTLQDQYNPGFHTDADKLDVQHLTAMAIQVNSTYVSGKATANDFELWIDDINFIE